MMIKTYFGMIQPINEFPVWIQEKAQVKKIFVRILLFYPFSNAKWNISSQLFWIWFQGYLGYGITYLCNKTTDFTAETPFL